MGTLVQPAAGCLCPENSLLSAVVESLELRQDEVVLMDTQAGVEHFGRALARGFRHAVVVTDPTFNAVQVALQTARLARDLGIPAIHLVINRVRGAGDEQKARERIEAEGGFPFTSVLAVPWDEGLLSAEPAVGPLLDDPASAFTAAARALARTLATTEEELVSCTS